MRHLLALRFQNVSCDHAHLSCSCWSRSVRPAQTSRLTLLNLFSVSSEQVYSDFLASDAARGVSETEWMCGDCKKTIAAASASGPNAASNALANAHCRRSEVDEESQDVRFQRMMHMLIAFYKSATNNAITAPTKASALFVAPPAHVAQLLPF